MNDFVNSLGTAAGSAAPSSMTASQVAAPAATTSAFVAPAITSSYLPPLITSTSSLDSSSFQDPAMATESPDEFASGSSETDPEDPASSALGKEYTFVTALFFVLLSL